MQGVNLKRHLRSDCTVVKHIYPGGVYISPSNIFEKLIGCGVDIPDDVPRFYKYFIVFDLESFQALNNLPPNSEHVIYQTHHQLCSGGIISNVPGYENARVFIVGKDLDSKGVADEILSYMLEISAAAYRYSMKD